MLTMSAAPQHCFMILSEMSECTTPQAASSVGISCETTHECVGMAAVPVVESTEEREVVTADMLILVDCGLIIDWLN
jgi:hypothetical protein